MGERTPWEVFYACPSASVVAFLDAAAALAPTAESSLDGAAALQTLSELASATQVSCDTSVCYQRRLIAAPCIASCLMSLFVSLLCKAQ